MNPELKERSQEQINEQRIAILKERLKKGILKEMSESSIVRTTALKFLIRYYTNKIYWYAVGILIGLLIIKIIQIWTNY